MFILTYFNNGAVNKLHIDPNNESIAVFIDYGQYILFNFLI